MTHIDHLTLDVSDPAAAERFYADAFDLGDRVRARQSEDPAPTGFRGFTLSLVVAQPATVDDLVDAAHGSGATVLKPARKSLWGYGGAVQAPDGTVVTLASSSKKNTGPGTREIDDIVVQLGVADVSASKSFYVDRGFTVEKSFGGRYAELATGPVTVTLNKLSALAKTAGVPEGSTSSHGLTLHADVDAFTDPDGFVWQAAGSPA